MERRRYCRFLGNGQKIAQLRGLFMSTACHIPFPIDSFWTEYFPTASAMEPAIGKRTLVRDPRRLAGPTPPPQFLCFIKYLLRNCRLVDPLHKVHGFFTMVTLDFARKCICRISLPQEGVAAVPLIGENIVDPLRLPRASVSKQVQRCRNVPGCLAR